MMRLYERFGLQGHSAILSFHALRATHICQRFWLPGLRRGLGKDRLGTLADGGAATWSCNGSLTATAIAPQPALL
jgi:hypothetical protein